MKFVHAADLHVDSPFLGLSSYDGAPEARVRLATRRALERVVDTCLAEQARFLVLAGDVFDSEWKDMNSGLFFVSQLERLRASACHVLLLRGNHDFDLTSWLRYPEHVHEFGSKVGDRTTFAFEREGIAFHGVSYPTRKVTESLLPLYAKPLAGLFNVGVLHTNATGSTQHAAYAPCTVAELVAQGYGYWALGHVHEHKVLHRDPWIVYPGNTQGRSVREVGEKGCCVVEVEGTEVRSFRFVPTDVMRYFVETIDLEHDDEREDLFARVRERLDDVLGRADGRLAAVRLLVRGSTRAHAAVVADPEAVRMQIRSDALATPDLWIEKVELKTTPAVSLDELREAKGVLADLLHYTEELRHPEAGADLTALGRALDPLRKNKSLAKELARVGLDLDEPGWMLEVLDEAEALLIERLVGSVPSPKDSG